MPGRSVRIVLASCLAAALIGCGRSPTAIRTARGLADGRALHAELAGRATGRSPSDIPASAAIALGYLERQRLGLGSPFRLMDYAARDTRLSDSLGARVRWAILARTLDGVGYQASPRVFLGADGDSASPRSSLGMIEETMGRAHDPLTGELAVRLAYALTGAQRVTTPRAGLVAVRAAAMLRDRALARLDARRLVEAARREGVLPIDLVSGWRTGHQFAVEAPPLDTLDRASNTEAIALAERLAARIEDQDSTAAEAMPHERASVAPSEGLPIAAAWRLSELARADSAPPSAEVIVSLVPFKRQVAHSAAAADVSMSTAWRFLFRSRTEESLVAERALFLDRVPSAPAERATLAAAVALRASAQESPWRNGDGGPTAAELASRFGVGVSFDDDVPNRWRPFYRSRLADALSDMQRALPALDLTGLRIVVTDNPPATGALALHDPHRRVIVLSSYSSAGALAHELAHDIDWQAARTRYAVRGDYATDRAVREQRGPLARSVRGLAAASAGPLANSHGDDSSSSDRPTEVFARAMDWFIASTLAAGGRSDGFLSSVQDEVLTGYVSVAPPDPSGRGAASLISLIDESLPLSADTRSAFLERYGPSHSLSPLEVTRVVAPPVARPGAALDDRARVVLTARDFALARLSRERCTGADARSVIARKRLVIAAADAQVRGIVLDAFEDPAAEARALMWAEHEPTNAVSCPSE